MVSCSSINYPQATAVCSEMAMRAGRKGTADYIQRSQLPRSSYWCAAPAVSSYCFKLVGGAVVVLTRLHQVAAVSALRCKSTPMVSSYCRPRNR